MATPFIVEPGEHHAPPELTSKTFPRTHPMFDETAGRLSADELDDLAAMVAPPAIPAIHPFRPDTPRAHVSREPVKTLRVAVLALSGVSAILSASFSYGFLSTVLPIWMAAPLSGVVIGAATIAPELAIVLWRRKRFALMSAVVAVGLIAGAFSMLSTIAGQYNARSTTGAAAMAGSRAEDAEARILDEIARLNRSIDTWQKRIDLAAADGRRDADAVYLKTKDEKAKAAREAELKSAQAGIVVERDDFYTWTARVIGGKPDDVEFALATFPALLLDITAPVFAVIGMVL